MSEIQAYWPGPSEVRDKLESSDGKTIVCVWPTRDRTNSTWSFLRLASLSLGRVTRRRGSDVLDFRAPRCTHQSRSRHWTFAHSSVTLRSKGVETLRPAVP